jgi:hypothetical protein
MRVLGFGVIAATLTFLAGCAGGKVYNEQFHANYRHLELMAEHGGKDMKLELLGAPTGADEAFLAEAVGTAMTGKNWGLPITFTTTPTETAGAPSRIVVLFSPAPSALGRRVCDGSATPSANGSPNSAIVAYCRRDLERSSVWIDLPPGAGVGTPAFEESLALATRALLPIRSPFDRTEDSDLCVGSC